MKPKDGRCIHCKRITLMMDDEHITCIDCDTVKSHLQTLSKTESGIKFIHETLKLFTEPIKARSAYEEFHL